MSGADKGILDGDAVLLGRKDADGRSTTIGEAFEDGENGRAGLIMVEDSNANVPVQLRANLSGSLNDFINYLYVSDTNVNGWQVYSAKHCTKIR